MANLVSNIDGVLEIYDDGTININHSSGSLQINSTEVLNSSNDGVFGDVRLNSLDFGDVSPTLTDGGERLLITTTNGWVTIGAENTSYAHLNTDRASFYFNKKLVVNSGVVQSYDEDLNLNRASSTTARLRIAAGTTTSDQDFNVTGDVTISGNLTVSGTETTVNTATLTVEDSVILLNSGQTTPVNDIGMVFQRFSAPTAVNYNPVIMWEEASDRIIFGATTELGADIDVGLTAEWMTVTGTGLVGIGTDSPNAHLHVNRGTTAGVYFYGGSNDRRQLVISSGTGDSTTLDALHDINASSTAGVLTLSTAGQERMRINSAGNITTTGNFDVTGNIAVSGTVDGVDIAARDTILSTAYGWGNHATPGYLTSVGINTLTDGYAAGDSIGLGTESLANDDGTANYNVGIGYRAGKFITTGYRNTFIGDRAGQTMVDGSSNVAIGSVVLYSATSATQNIALGSGSLYTLISGNRNFAAHNSLQGLTTGDDNIAIGYNSQMGLTTQAHNISLGNGSLQHNVTGQGNVAIGRSALQGVATNSHIFNTAIGYEAGKDITTGGNNLFAGYRAGENITTGSTNVALGVQALRNTKTGSGNISIGQDSLSNVSNTAASNNVAIGQAAGDALTTGSENIIIGFGADAS